MDEFFASANMILVILGLILGLVLLVKGADFFVEGSSSIAKRLKVPSIIIGLTIVAMGTSLPETAVSVTAGLAGNNELAISNAVGSNIFNLIVVLGVCALISPVPVQKILLKRDIPFSVICAVLLLVLGLIGPMTLGRFDGIGLLVLFVIFIVYLVITAMKEAKANKDKGDEDDIKLVAIPLCIVYVIGGAAAIAFGGDMVVSSASRIATELGMSQTLIGLTIVSIGTSLPELVTSIVAARKKEVELALGNAVGSNVFNILMVLGIASSISPITFITENVVDISILIFMSIVVWIFAATRKEISRIEGSIMLLLYVGYSAYIFIR